MKNTDVLEVCKAFFELSAALERQIAYLADNTLHPSKKDEFDIRFAAFLVAQDNFAEIVAKFSNDNPGEENAPEV